MLMTKFLIDDSSSIGWNVKIHWEHNHCAHQSVFEGPTREAVLNEVADFFQPYLQDITPFQQETLNKIPADTLARLFSTLTSVFENTEREGS